MTEEEAKNKWCPFTRILFHSDTETGPTSFNRVHHPDRGINDNPDDSRCIGSECMMWRGFDDQGYCGLATQPHDVITKRFS